MVLSAARDSQQQKPFPAPLVPALALLAALRTRPSSEECPAARCAKDALEFASVLCFNHLPLLEGSGLYNAIALYLSDTMSLFWNHLERREEKK